MNGSTRETLENLSIASLRRMERLRLNIQRAQREIDGLREEVRAEIKAVEENLNLIAISDPSFDKDAWLNYAQRELV